MQFDEARGSVSATTGDNDTFTTTCHGCQGIATCYRGLDDEAVWECEHGCKEEEILGDEIRQHKEGTADNQDLVSELRIQPGRTNGTPSDKKEHDDTTSGLLLAENDKVIRKLDANPWTPMQDTAIEPILRRVPPQNIEAEQALLGSLMVEPTILDAVQQTLTASDFYRESHRDIYKAVLELAAFGKLAATPESAVDLVSLKHELNRKGIFEAVGGLEYLQKLEAATPTSLNWPHWAAIIKECATKRDIIRGAADLMQVAYNGSNVADLANRIERLTPFSIQANRQNDRPPLLLFYDSARLAEEAGEKEHIVEDLLTTGDMSGWAAKKGIGKSTLLRTLAVAVAYGQPFLGLHTNRCKVWYIDLEPGSQQKRHEAFQNLGWGPDSDNLRLTQCSPLAGKPWVFTWLEENIIKYKFGMVVIDTALKLAKVDQGNDYGSGLIGLNPLEEIIKKTGVHICAVFHSQKNGNPMNPNASAADLILGSVALAGGLGVCFALRRHKGGPGGGARISLFMDPPRYVEQRIKGEWILEKDVMTGQITLGKTLGEDWWTNAKADVLALAKTLPQPFAATAITDRLPDYKLKEVKRILTAMCEEHDIEESTKESRRGGSIRYVIKEQGF